MKYQLTAGTRLADRYRIEGVIGYGGFSITYLGMDEHVQTKVAIKELYVSEYMGRDAEITSDVFLLREEDRGAFEKAREDFLKEAIIVGIFNGDAGIVSVLDHFRENNTAYIVMEYLEGVSLHQYLKRNGVMESEEVFQRMLPLISTLQKIHDSEVIHRDISPDNIMVMPDGTFKLIDFGAARNYASQIKMSHIVKDGYAPPEQWNEEGAQGPWTDIYALCATMYECITGITPESSIQRMFFDDMKKPSELKILINKDLEKILWKGMAIIPEERYQNLKEMECEIKKILPDPVPDQPVGKKTKIAAVLCGAVIIGLSAITGTAIYRNYKEAHKFAGIPTQVTAIYPHEETTAQEYYKAREVLEGRIQVLTGDLPYQIDEKKNGELLITLPKEVFGEEEPEKVYQDLLLGKWECKISSWGDAGQIILCSIEPDDIVSADACEGHIPVDKEKFTNPLLLEELEKAEHYVEIVLKDEKIQKIQEKILPGKRTLFWIDYDEETENGLWCNLYLNDQMNRFYLYDDYVDDPVLQNLQIYDLTHERFKCNVSYMCDINAEWEQVDNNMLAGKCQRNAEEIQDPAATVIYGPAAWSTEEIQRGEWLYKLINMKERLDALEVPYAIGMDGEDGSKILVKIKQSDASTFVLQTLMKYSGIIEIGSLWESAYFDLTYDNISIKTEQEDSGEKLVITEEEDLYSNYIKEYTESVWKQGGKRLYLRAGRYLLGKCQLTEPVTDRRLVFDLIPAKYQSPFAKDLQSMVDYLTVFTKQTSMSYGLGPTYELDDIICTDENGELTALDRIEPDISMLNEKNELKNELEALYPECRIKEPVTWNDTSFTIDLDLGQEKNWKIEVPEIIKQIYNLNEMKRGWIDDIWLNFRTDEKTATVYLHKNPDKRNYTVSLWNFQGADQEKEELKKGMLKDSFFIGKLNEGFEET